MENEPLTAGWSVHSERKGEFYVTTAVFTFREPVICRPLFDKEDLKALKIRPRIVWSDPA